MRLAYDTKLDRPACVLVAAALGGDPHAASLFPSETWLLTPTPDMSVYDTTPEQVAILVRRNRERA